MLDDPRVVGEQRTDLVWRVTLDRKQRHVLRTVALDRAAEHDDAAIDKAVHEPGVLGE